MRGIEERVPPNPAYGTGVFRRRLLVEAETGRARGELEDDFHHFAAELTHDGARIREVRGRAVRAP